MSTRNLDSELHRLVFGETCGYSLEFTNVILPSDAAKIRSLLPSLDRKQKAYAKKLLKKEAK